MAQAANHEDDDDEDLESAALGLATRRELAVGRARLHALAQLHERHSSTGVGLCRYGPGCVAMALAGTTDAAGLARFRELAPGIEHAGQRELVIELAGLTGWSPELARLIGRLRIRRLIDHVRVEIRGVPPAAESELLAGHGVEIAGGSAAPAPQPDRAPATPPQRSSHPAVVLNGHDDHWWWW